MYNQFVIGVELGTKPIIIITGNDAGANGIAADLFYDTHFREGLFCFKSAHYFPQYFSGNIKSRENGSKGSIPPFILECQLILKAAEAEMVKERIVCLSDYFPFSSGYPLMDKSPNRFLNDSRKLNKIWN